MGRSVYSFYIRQALSHVDMLNHTDKALHASVFLHQVGSACQLSCAGLVWSPQVLSSGRLHLP